MNHVRPNGLTIRPSTYGCTCRTCNQPCCDNLRTRRYTAISLSNAIDGGLGVESTQTSGGSCNSPARSHRIGNDGHTRRRHTGLARLSLGSNRFNYGAAGIRAGHTQHRSRDGQEVGAADKLGPSLHTAKNKPSQVNRSINLCTCSNGVLGPCS